MKSLVLFNQENRGQVLSTMIQSSGGGNTPYPEIVPPICWTADERIVADVKIYVSKWLLANPEPSADDPRYRRVVAHRAIMERISHNLHNPNWRAYPSEISYSTVARALRRESTSESDLAGIIAALDAAWKDIRGHFAQNFTKRSNPGR